MFAFSKLAWSLIQPSNLLLFLLILASAALLLGWRRSGTWLTCGVSAVLLTVTVLPVGAWLLLPIENRFPPPPPEQVDGPGQVDGIVMLGGAVDGPTSAQRGQITLNEAAERVTTLVELSRRYPDARLVVSGGAGTLFAGPGRPVRALEKFFPAVGVDVGRITFEEASRNTYENAVFSKQLVNPQPGERWLLVTSAHHMPRAIGVFRAAGWQVTAYPVDYLGGERASFDPGDLAEPNVTKRLLEFDLAVKSWVGLAAYWVLGRTNALFPTP